MPRKAKGELRWTDDGPVGRITLKGRLRKPFLLAACRTEDEARERMCLVADLAGRFRRAGIVETPDAIRLLEGAAAATPALVSGYLKVAAELLGGELVDRGDVPTFREIAKQWTGGELARTYPDHVAPIASADQNAKRLEFMCDIDVGGMKLGDIPVDRFTIDHAQAAMRALPKDVKRPATRRQYAQIIHRVLALAVYPLRVLASNPLPRGFMPKAGKPPGFAFLYPDEESRLMACAAVPLWRRVYFGVLAREGARCGEAKGWRRGVEVDLVRGVVTLDKNKSNDPRAWALDPGVALALRAWCELRGIGQGEALFQDEAGGTPEDPAMVRTLRADLEAAGVDRAELHKAGENRRPLRVHDLRGTFVTLSLANGRTETWVADRTGHRSSQMINRYRRAARQAGELGLGALGPLVFCIPELSPIDAIAKALAVLSAPADFPAIAPNAATLGSDEAPKAPESKGGSTGIRTLDQRIKNGPLDSSERGESRIDADRENEQAPSDPSLGQSRGNPDAVEAALADALSKAAASCAWDAVAVLTRELEARRRARQAPGVVDLEAARAKRGR